MSKCHSAEQSEAYDYMKYALVLGRNPDLSIAELFNVLGNKIQVARNKICIFSNSPLSLPPQNFLNRLGGTTEIIEIFKYDIGIADIEKEILDFLEVRAEKIPGKFYFAINLLPEKKDSRVLKMLLPTVKKSLRSKNIKANFMNNNFQNASPVFVKRHGALELGTNINIIELGENRVALGRSIAIQDFDAYSKRDYGKPFRDPKAGMMPPKLAQIMINLGISKPLTKLAPLTPKAYSLKPIIFDPFCGTGTVLMEALLMGYSAIGSDSENKMAEGAGKNIEWLRQNFKIASDAKSFIFTKDAAKISSGDLNISTLTPHPSPLAVVTEPYLGPELSSFPAPAFLEKVIFQLSDLYLKFFKNLRDILEPGVLVVIIFPVWNKGKGEKIRLADRIIDKIMSLGYSMTEFDPLKTTSLFYDRPGQVVGREIVRFRKT